MLNNIMASSSERIKNIFLIGDIKSSIDGDQLPSNGQVLQVLFYYIKIINPRKKLRVNCESVIEQVKVFWERVRLPVKYEARCIDKLLDLHSQWLNLHKNAGKYNLEKEEKFSADLENLFDIADNYAIESTKIHQRSKDFLTNQRRDGSVGSIIQIERYYEQIDRVENKKKELIDRRIKKSNKEIDQTLDDLIELASSEDSSFTPFSQRSIRSFSEVTSENDSEAGPSAPKKTRGIINIFSNPKVIAALDKCKVSDRAAVHLVGAIAEALNVDLDSLVLNRSSIKIQREKIREEQATQIKKVFQETELKALVLHWDGKLFYDSLKMEMLDRLPVTVSNGRTEKLLGVPVAENGKGVIQANAVYEVLYSWGLQDSVKALCCDTTASNLGIKNGAAVLLERLLGTNFLFLPCRHHLFELVLRCVFERMMPATTGPNVPLFLKFRNSWKNIDKSKYQTGLEYEIVLRHLSLERIEELRSFVQDSLEYLQPRADYKEFLNLTLIFLGSVQPNNIYFHQPGAFHHARWMAKAIYCLKIFIFRSEFQMTSDEIEAIRSTSLFIVMLYVKAWFTCTVKSKAPNLDLSFLKKLHDYRLIDEEVSAVTLQKFCNHLWYLNPECAAISFFDESLPLEVKRKMVLKLSPLEDTDSCYPKRIQISGDDISSLCEKQMDYFITPQSRNLFLRFEIDDQFLKIDPALWDQNKNYQRGLKIIKNFKVVNDVAERGVHLFSEYNDILTRNEEQKIFVLQIVSEYRKIFPDFKKETIMKQYLF